VRVSRKRSVDGLAMRSAGDKNLGCYPSAGPRSKSVVVRIQLVAYDSEWPSVFRKEEVRIRAALGERALAVEHVGSTAVPGLARNP
jgi:hypothetical protein